MRTASRTAQGQRVYFIVCIAIGLCTAARISLADSADNLDPAQIKAALHTVAEEEDGFIDRSVAMVNAGSLPRDLFISTFLWARRKPTHQFQYFKRGLIERAAAQGITVK